VEEDSKTRARKVLEAAGYSVSDIPESDVPGEKRADLRCVQGDDRLIVEAKGKSAHAAYLDLQARSREPGGAAMSREIKPWSALSSVIEEAARQLEHTPSPSASARVVVVRCAHRDWRFVFDAIERCLYGLTELALWVKTDDLPELTGTKPCYYYEHSMFRRLTIVDAVVFDGPAGSRLLVDEFGDARDLLMESRLATHYARGSALRDPVVERENGTALGIITAQRLTGRDRHSYLLKTYGFLTNPMTEYQMDGLLTLSREQVEADTRNLDVGKPSTD
jgi:hypothetical protein